MATRLFDMRTGTHSGECLMLLADGMGGHAGGEVASNLVVETFADSYANSPAAIPDALDTSLDHANNQIARTVAKSPAFKGMATTLIGCVVRENLLYWISVGDSPLWVLRAGSLLRLNADHSMLPILEEMVRDGRLDAEDMKVDYRRHLLRSGVAGKPIKLIDLCATPWQLELDDLVILASDGVETLAEEEMVNVLGNPAAMSLQDLACALMTRIQTAAHPGQDNASVILYRHSGTRGQE